MRNITRKSYFLTGFIFSASWVAQVEGAVHFVTTQGSAAPLPNDPARPWQSVGAAAVALPSGGGEVRIGAGTYREAFTLVTPCHLAAPSGPATIGDFTTGVTASTSFSVFTWNTHLAGDEVFFPDKWLDYERAEEMGRYFHNRRDEIDLVSLCEVWDQDLFLGGDGAAGIRPLSGYSNGMHGTRVDNQSEGCALAPKGFPPTILNSGLAMMTELAMSDPLQVSFSDCDGSCPTDKSPDCLASKGFIVSTVVKDKFTLRIYNTHTQSADSTSAVEARENQIKQLAAHIRSYQMANPSHVVLLMGDMNVIGDGDLFPTEGDQYYFLRDQLGAVGGHDAARNAAIVSMYNSPGIAHTFTSSNQLALHFDPTPYNHRLDYVWYFPSLDGRVQVSPTYVNSPRVSGPIQEEDGFSSDELSDHYPVEARFQLIRVD